MARALDGRGEAALVLGTCAGAAARQNLATLRNKALKPLHIFVVRAADALGAERAYLAPGNKPAPPVR